MEQFQLDLDGLGIIFYSPHAVSHIHAGERYLMEHYNKVEDVVQHIYEGSIVGFATGSPGTFMLTIYQDIYPNFDELAPDWALKLCLTVTENTVFFRDLYTLMRYKEATDSDIKITLENGNYEVIVCSWMPETDIRGDHQAIHIYFNKKEELPKLHYEGVPSFV